LKTWDISDPFLYKFGSLHRELTKNFFSSLSKVKRTKGYFFNIISNWKLLSVEIGYMALLVAFDIPSEFDVLLAACG
jgi:hypothetical protein